MEKKGLVIGILAVVLVVLVGFAIFWVITGKKSASSEEDVTFSVDEEQNLVIAPGENMERRIEITSSGFSPQTVTIKQGESVTWINKQSNPSWPASALHPTHTVYPGVNYEEGGTYGGSKGCNSEGDSKDGAFDPCRGLEEGESWSFTFEQVGSWGYHDHLQLGKFGKIIVE